MAEKEADLIFAIVASIGVTVLFLLAGIAGIVAAITYRDNMRALDEFEAKLRDEEAA